MVHSSNSFALPFTHPHFVPFDQLIPAAAQAAAEVGNTEHSFKAVQFPGNVLEREASLAYVRTAYFMEPKGKW